MGAITKQQFIQEVDKLTAAMLEVVPSILSGATSSSTPGLGDSTIIKGAGTDYGVQSKLRDLETLILGFQDGQRINYQWGNIERVVPTVAYQIVVRSLLNDLLTECTNDINASGYSNVSGIDGLSSYFNTGAGGNWQALLPPDFIALYNACYSANPNALNVYPPPLLNSPGLGSVASNTLTPVATPFDTTKYAGFLPSMILGVVTSTMTIATGSGSIVLAGNGKTANGTANSPTPFVGTNISHQLTCNVSGATIASGTILVFTGNAADIYTSITGLTLTNVSGGAFWIAGMPPTTAPAGAPAGASGVTVPSTITRTSPPT